MGQVSAREIEASAFATCRACSWTTWEWSDLFSTTSEATDHAEQTGHSVAVETSGTTLIERRESIR